MDHVSFEQIWKCLGLGFAIALILWLPIPLPGLALVGLGLLVLGARRWPISFNRSGLAIATGGLSLLIDYRLVLQAPYLSHWEMAIAACLQVSCLCAVVWVWGRQVFRQPDA